MAETAEQVTELLVLRKTPYQDHALIINGISPTEGQMSFFLRQPSTISRRSYRFFDLFQEVNVAYRRSSGELCYSQRAEVTADYAGVAQSPEAFQAACWLSGFALANVLPHLAMPRFYRAVQVALVRLVNGRPLPEGVLTGLGLAYLEEAGVLNLEGRPASERAQCELLLRMAAGGDFPGLPDDNWRDLWQWTRRQLQAAECAAV